MAAWGYEFYLLMLKVFHSLASFTRERYFQHEDKIRIPTWPCNILYISGRPLPPFSQHLWYIKVHLRQSFQIVLPCIICFSRHFFPVFSHRMLMFVFYPCVSLLLSFSDDHSRVILSLTENDPESHYINANYIDVSGIMKLCLK